MRHCCSNNPATTDQLVRDTLDWMFRFASAAWSNPPIANRTCRQPRWCREQPEIHSQRSADHLPACHFSLGLGRSGTSFSSSWVVVASAMFHSMPVDVHTANLIDDRTATPLANLHEAQWQLSDAVERRHVSVVRPRSAERAAAVRHKRRRAPDGMRGGNGFRAPFASISLVGLGLGAPGEHHAHLHPITAPGSETTKTADWV